MRPETPPDESDVLEKVETALKQAVREHPDLRWDYGTRIKRQKYVYLAVDHFTPEESELPVTYSWYKFGACLPAAPETGTIGPASREMPTADARQSSLFTTGFTDLVEFFSDELSNPALNSDYWFASDLDFLESFYESNAPEEYRELYLANIEFRRHLGDVVDRLQENSGGVGDGSASMSDRSIRTTPGPDRGNRSIDERGADDTETVVSEREYEVIGRAAARMHMGLVEADVLENTLQDVRCFTNLVEDAFLVLSQTRPSEVTPEQVAALTALETTYSEWVWEFPALLVSKVTATGPNAPTLRRWSEQKHFSVEDNLEDEINAAQRQCEDADLRPASDDYPDPGDALETVARQGVLSAMRRDE